MNFRRIVLLSLMTKITVLNAADYKFDFVTGDDTAAATDAQVYVTLRGIVGEHTFYFNGSGSVFSVGGSDTFERDGPAVGKLGDIIIGHDGAGVGSEYDLKSLIITDNIGSFTYNITCGHSNCFIPATNPIKSTSQVAPVLDMSQWNAWEACTPCPNGNRQRYRPCLAEYPQFGLNCVTGQTPHTVTCVCDCLTPTNNGSSKDSTLTNPSGNTTVGAEVHYICNNGKRWKTGTATLVFRCSEYVIWEPIDNAIRYAYDHGCINCGSPPVLGDATYQTLDNVTTVDSEAAVNCSSGKRLPDGSTTVTMKCVWDASTDSYKWVANTGSMNFIFSSSLSWQIQINGEGWQPWTTPECTVPRAVLGNWGPWSQCTRKTRLQTRRRECLREYPESTCADASPPETKQCACAVKTLKLKSNGDCRRVVYLTVKSTPRQHEVPFNVDNPVD